MANHASAEKRNRQRIVRTERNRSIRQAVRTAVKKARTALAGGDEQAAKDRISEATRALAKAASKGVVHKKAAARTTSRIHAAFQRRSAS
ncbi:MAG TPA: 30S ribosomal protein S20 [Polyangiaceae bacterium]|nr:30S ribosomal protein S20 [Polyangiaceae bacterium]